MILTIISIITILIYALFFIKNQRLSILGIILLLPTYLIRLNILEIPTTFLELILIGSFVGFLYKFIKYRPDIKFYNFLLPLIFFLISAIISTKISNQSIQSLGILKSYIIEPVIFFIIFINTFKTKKEIEIIINTLGVTALYLSIYAIFQKITGIGIGIDDPSWAKETTRRVTSVFPYPNALGLFLAPIVTIFLFRIIIKINLSWNKINTFIISLKNQKLNTQNNFKCLIINLRIFILNNLFDLIVLLTSLFAIIFAKSSGALIGIIFSIFIFIFIKSKNKLTFFLISFLFIISLITLPFTYPKINKTILLGDFSGKIRIQMWEETSKMLKENFIFGGGLNNFKEALKPYHKKTFFELYLYPHNIILNIWSELGLLGLISFLFFIYIFFKKNYINYTNKIDSFWLKNLTEKIKVNIEYKKNTSIILSLSFSTLLIHGIVDVPFFKNDLSILFWIIIGITIINEKIEDNIIVIK